VLLRVTVLALATALLLAALGLLAQRVDPPLGHVPLIDAAGRSFWVPAIALALACGVAFQLADRTGLSARATAVARGVRYEPYPDLPVAWILPFTTATGAVLLLSAYHSSTAIAAISLGAFLFLVAGMGSRHYLYDAEEQTRSYARIVHTLVVHGVALGTLSMIYINKLRSLYSGTAVFVLAGLLLLQLTEAEDVPLDRRVLYAVVGGLVLGEITWVLNYWRATGWLGGAVLLVFFYLLAGIVLVRMQREVLLRDVLEYGVVAAVAFTVLVWATLR
jgi:hypothetical protein